MTTFFRTFYLLLLLPWGGALAAPDPEDEIIASFREVTSHSCNHILLDFSAAREAELEQRIDSNESRIRRALYRISRKHSRGNRVEIERMRLVLVRRKGLLASEVKLDDLTDLAPTVGLFDQDTLDRWRWLKAERGAQFREVALRDFAQWGSQAEFYPAWYHPGSAQLGLNFLFDLDTWLPGLAADDLEEPNSVLVEAIHFAYFQVRFSQDGKKLGPRPSAIFHTWFQGLVESRAAFFSAFAEDLARQRSAGKEPNDLQRWEACQDTTWMVWGFMARRTAMEAAARFYRTNRRRLPGRSALYEGLDSNTVRHGQLVNRYGFPESLADELFDVVYPTELLAVPPR